jgi:hypothetical protein
LPEPCVLNDEVANRWCAAEDSVRPSVERKNLLAHRVGRLWNLMLNEVDAWIRSHDALDPPLDVGGEE